MKLIVGLGNPGQEYEKTRHSIGFFLVDAIVSGTFKYDEKYKSELCKDQDVLFLKPMEFMNRSGGAVSAVAKFYKIDAKDILVIHDDIDLPVGKVQLKLGGSSAGHNGLKDIILKLGTKEFYRLRIGVDRPANQDDASHGRSTEVADYVLSDFKKEEKKRIEDKMSEIEDYISEFLKE
ncbi:MAG: aminoacyl-tRNA hydrolase [candidate division SR1 bacterium]|nr:aminoacyl-tRNA hydrolase [candidate division SR1 bacterium]